MAQKQKVKEKLKNKNQLAQKKRCGQMSVKAVQEVAVVYKIFNSCWELLNMITSERKLRISVVVEIYITHAASDV